MITRSDDALRAIAEQVTARLIVRMGHSTTAEAVDIVFAALVAARDEGQPQWQPIETAPKDAEPWLLLAWPHWRSRAVVGRWSHVIGGWWTDVKLKGDDPGPTHWMPLLPLPAPPVDQKGPSR